MINGFVNAVISSLEQRFGLKSTETGVIAGSYDIGSMLSVIPITYFGGKFCSTFCTTITGVVILDFL